jgi:mono/diheme cytochrome c family protein
VKKNALVFLGALTLCLVVAGGGIFFGVYNVAATEREPAAVAWFLETVRERSVAVRAARVPVPSDLDLAERRRRGLAPYHRLCSSCHGAPGIEPAEMGRGLSPPAPDLQPSRPLSERQAQEAFWIIRHGIRMTGMPAYGPSLEDQEIWDLVAFLSELAELSPGEYGSRLRQAGQGEEPESGEESDPRDGS